MPEPNPDHFSPSVGGLSCAILHIKYAKLGSSEFAPLEYFFSANEESDCKEDDTGDGGRIVLAINNS